MHPGDDVAASNTSGTGRLSVMIGAVATDGPLFETSTVKLTISPASIVAGPVLSITRSATRVTGLLTADWLLFGSVSGVSVVTDDALFSSAPSASVGSLVTSMVMRTVSPEASVPRSQVSSAAPLHVDPLSGVADTSVTPAGSTSETIVF